MDPYFIPGDSIVVTCDSPLGGGINEGGVTGGGEVYMHVRCTDIWPGRPGGVKPNIYGSSLEGTYGTYVSDDGSEWTVFPCDTAKCCGNNPMPDHWSVDLNDSLLTRGYMAEYYFSSMDVAGDVTTLPDGGSGPGAGGSLSGGPPKLFEFTCLPTGRSDVLYVDDFHGRGCHEGLAELYYQLPFRNLLYEDWPDRYDVNSPSSMLGNGLESRVTLNQLLYNELENSGYTVIIWDSGDLDVGTIGDGNPTYEKTDDCTLLNSWLDQSNNDVGLWIAGNSVASDLTQNLGSTQALELLNMWCGVDLFDKSYFEFTGGREGGVINPVIDATLTGIYSDCGGEPLEFYLCSGCPVVGHFDVLLPVNAGVEALMYPEFNEETWAAGIQSEQINSSGYDARTLLLGFSMMEVRNTDFDPPLAREWLVYKFLDWVGHGITTDAEIPGDGDQIPKAYSLSQNYPNPFNPTTTIKFDIRNKGQVSLRIYNVAGQLVRTLVDSELEAGSYAEEWTGLNNDGSKVASGVYFYRLEAGSFESVKKMVLLR